MSQIQRALRACAETKVTPLTPHWADDARRLMHQAADALDAADEAMAASAPQAAPASHAEFALRALVAAGHITQAKADEAMQIAERAAPQTKEPTHDR